MLERFVLLKLTLSCSCWSRRGKSFTLHGDQGVIEEEMMIFAESSFILAIWRKSFLRSIISSLNLTVLVACLNIFYGFYERTGRQSCSVTAMFSPDCTSHPRRLALNLMRFSIRMRFWRALRFAFSCVEEAVVFKDIRHKVWCCGANGFL
jgi:hypothetical protein